jgi:hypothetical protein
MKATNKAAEVRNTAQTEEPQNARPYCAGKRCKTCPHAETCRNYWGANAERWDAFSDAEITRAVELMISPDDLTIRGAALALFAVFGYTPEDIREQLDSGKYFNAGAVFTGLDTDRPQIIQAITETKSVEYRRMISAWINAPDISDKDFRSAVRAITK